MSRPAQFEINTGHSLAQGLVFAALGRHTHTTYCHDSSPYYNHGALTGMDPATDWTWVPELGRWALDFLASASQSVVCPLVFASNSRSLVAWVNATGIGSTHTLLCADKAGSAQDGCVVDYQDASGWRWFGYQSSTAKGLGTSGALPAGWHHAAFTFDGTLWKIYINGTEVKSTSSAATLNGNDGGFVIGNRAASYLTSRVSDVLAWDGRALSASEIQSLADPANVMLSGLILPPRRSMWAMPAGAIFPSTIELPTIQLAI